MSLVIQPLIWKNYDKREKDDVWPRKVIGASLVYLEDQNRYFMIGGNFNAYENGIKNIKLNKEIISGVNRDINDFNKLNSEKISYLTGSIYTGGDKKKTIDVYIFETEPDKKWYKVTTRGRVPRARSFQRCVYVGKQSSH